MKLFASPNIAIHVLFGAVGLVVGLIPLILKKGSVAHRYWGRYFILFAGIVLATAIVGIAFGNPPTALVAVTLTSGYQYVSSLRALWLRQSGPKTLDAFMAILVFVLIYLVWSRSTTSTASWPPAIAYSTLGYLGMVALYDLSRHFWSDLWLSKFRPLDHGVKMIGVYFGMMSAGAGNLLTHLQPWSQLVPTSLGMLVLLFFIVGHFRNLRRTSGILV